MPLSHQGDADAAAALIGLDGERAQEQRRLAADANRPEAHRAAQDPVLDGDEAEAGDRRHALAQAPGRFGEAAGAEAGRHQSLDQGAVLGPLGADLPGAALRLTHGPCAFRGSGRLDETGGG